MSFLPGRHLSARFSPTFTINSHTRACGVWRDQNGVACGSLFDRPRRNGRYQRRTSDAYAECGSFCGANDHCYRLLTRHLDEGRQAGNCVRPCPSRLRTSRAGYAGLRRNFTTTTQLDHPKNCRSALARSHRQEIGSCISRPTHQNPRAEER
jgi:hypothetical protein